MTAAKKKTTPKITINFDWCKDCCICVDICPEDVFELCAGSSERTLSRIVARRPEDCTRCMLCEMHCPDLAIEVE